MQEPQISILIPTYNPNPAHLRGAVESVLAQTEQRWSLLIHDDASAVDVKEQAQSFLEDPRIRFLRSDKRLGIGGNWNACLKHRTSTPYVQFLFQDDLWEPTYLERALKAMEEDATDFAVVDHAYAFEDMNQVQPMYEKLLKERRGSVEPGRHEGKDFLRGWLQKGLHPNLLGEPSFVMLRRSLVESAGPFCEDMPQFLDSEYWSRCCLHGNFSFIAQELGSFRVHQKGASAQNEESGAGIYDRFRCFQLIIQALPPGELRSQAIQARDSALQTMVGKFFRRVGGGKKVKTKGSGPLLKFILQHPILFALAVLRAHRT